MEIIIGTYEGPVVSYAAKLSDSITFEPQFIEKSHSGCVKSIACNNRYLASGNLNGVLYDYEIIISL